MNYTSQWYKVYFSQVVVKLKKHNQNSGGWFPFHIFFPPFLFSLVDLNNFFKTLSFPVSFHLQGSVPFLPIGFLLLGRTMFFNTFQNWIMEYLLIASTSLPTVIMFLELFHCGIRMLQSLHLFLYAFCGPLLKSKVTCAS